MTTWAAALRCHVMASSIADIALWHIILPLLSFLIWSSVTCGGHAWTAKSSIINATHRTFPWRGSSHLESKPIGFVGRTYAPSLPFSACLAPVSPWCPLALGQSLAPAVGAREGALAATPRLGVGLVHLGIDLVVTLGGLLGGRVRNWHRPEWGDTALREKHGQAAPETTLSVPRDVLVLVRARKRN